MLADEIKRRHDGMPVPTEKLTFGQYLTDRWLPIQKSRVRASTYDSYRRNIDLHVLPALGRRPLDKLSPDDLDQTAVRHGASTEAERAAQLLSTDLGRDLVLPKLGQSAQKQRGAGADHRGPALLDIGIRQLEPDPADPRIRMVDRGEDEGMFTFHAHVGRETPDPPPRNPGNW